MIDSVNWPSPVRATVGELALWLRVTAKDVKRVSGKRSVHSRLSEEDLDRAVERLKDETDFKLRKRDLSPLDAVSGDWVHALRDLYALPVSVPASIPPSQGVQIRELIERVAPIRAAEVGSFIGVSSIWIASGLGSGSTLTAVDTFWPKYPSWKNFSFLRDPLNVATKAVEAASLSEMVDFHKADSVDFARSLSRNDEFDFVFLDGDHTFGGVTRDFAAWYPHVEPGGYLLLHDINPKYCGWDGPRRLIDGVLAINPNLVIEEIETKPNYGIALIKKVGDGDRLQLPVAIRFTILRSRIRTWLVNSYVGRSLLSHVLKPLLLVRARRK